MILPTKAVKPVLLSGVLAVVLAGCVTINIYFPAAAAEKAADKIIDEVLQVKPIAKTNIEKPASN